MKREFIVIDEEGNISWNPKTEKSEAFATFKAAKARAHILATCAPGRSIKIYELTAETVAPVAPAATTRKHPLEHYS